MDDFRIVDAEAEVVQARARLLDTVGAIADRLEPRKILNEIWDSAKEKSAVLAGDAVDAVRSRPVAATGVLAAMTMFIARGPLKHGLSNIYDALTSDSDEQPEEDEATIAKPPTSRKPRTRRTATTEKTE